RPGSSRVRRISTRTSRGSSPTRRTPPTGSPTAPTRRSSRSPRTSRPRRPSGLVEGSEDLDSNLTWVISNEEDAADGLADGT
ncbi:hypothetical protein CTI14_67770, partial [Methylobacterium radiotolerans]